ncbi:MAG: hypothetical protein R3338_04920 [Thermoanaerobaculia bacterium]|nr:hypothetical protein [Thermoanaerobaculia bacterium]
MRIDLADSTVLTQCVILFAVFDGDPNEWASWLLNDGSDRQRKDDLPFVRWLIDESCRDETFIRDLRLLVVDAERRSH